jgi:hypothetical protein
MMGYGLVLLGYSEHKVLKIWLLRGSEGHAYRYGLENLLNSRGSQELQPACS